jgi:hypothetical protein
MPTTKGMTGSYNRDSRTQQEDFAHSLECLLECIDATVGEGGKQYSIVDYGCSLGANSILAMNRLIRYIQRTSRFPVLVPITMTSQPTILMPC